MSDRYTNKLIKTNDEFIKAVNEGFVTFIGSGKPADWNKDIKVYITVMPIDSYKCKWDLNDKFYISYNCCYYDNCGWHKDVNYRKDFMPLSEVMKPENIIGWYLKNGVLRGYEQFDWEERWLKNKVTSDEYIEAIKSEIESNKKIFLEVFKIHFSRSKKVKGLFEYVEGIIRNVVFNWKNISGKNTMEKVIYSCENEAVEMTDEVRKYADSFRCRNDFYNEIDRCIRSIDFKIKEGE